MGVMKKVLGISSATVLVFVLFFASCCGCGLFGAWSDGQDLTAARQLPTTSPQTILEAYENLERIERRWADTASVLRNPTHLNPAPIPFEHPPKSPIHAEPAQLVPVSAIFQV